VTGASAPLHDTICQRLLDGTVDSIVRDTSGDERTRDLPVVRQAGLAAYIGVPLTASAVRSYVLCCLAREVRPDLTDADVRFLRALIESLRPAIEAVPADD
jgi:GAF domain-containing protein